MFDTLIKNASVYNGLNQKPQLVDVAIQGEKIAAIDTYIPESNALKTIEAKGLILTPGFIDPHASTGFGYFFPHAADHKLYQGITTEIFGNCGTSPGPIGSKLVPTMERLSREIGFPFEWRSMGEYFEEIEDKLQFNIATMVGHSSLRAGYVKDWNHITKGELAEMKKALAQAMDEGALGISTGLIYAPGCFADTEEIIELAQVVQKRGGIYASHIRDERDQIEEAVEEALKIGHEANIPVLISHLKAAEKKNWGKIPHILKKIETYNQSHELQARVDVYPYTAVSTKLRAFIPKYILQDGIDQVPKKLTQPKVLQDIADWIAIRSYDLDRMLIISNEFEAFCGKSVAAIAREQQQTEAETIAEILTQSTEMWIVYHCISEQDMDTAISWKLAMICTDSWSYPINSPQVIGKPHPRSYGAFTQYLQDYVFEKKLLSLEEAIHKITFLPAQFFKLKGRGQIQQGFYADLVAFRANKIRANATYLDPKRISDGVHHLWVNGQQVIESGKMNDSKSGKILRGHRHA